MNLSSRPVCLLAWSMFVVLGGLVDVAAAQATAQDLMADRAEYEVYRWLLERAGKQEHVQLKPDGRLDWIGFAGENRYTCGLQLDAAGHVIQATFNQAGFYNNELERLAAWKKLRKLTAWHNFREGELHKFREGENPTSGAGLAAFGEAALESVNFGGSPFDDEGLKAAAGVPSLKELIVYHTRVSDQGCRHLRGNSHVEYLRLGPQFSMRISDACLEHVATMKALKHLEINETHLTWNGLRQLTALQDTLEQLTFNQAWIAEEDLAKLRQALPRVELSYTPAEAKQVEQMQRAEQRRAEKQN
jgi:hypothetical protein